MVSYITSGLTAAIGGIVLASMTQQGMASTGSGYDTEVICVAKVTKNAGTWNVITIKPCSAPAAIPVRSARLMPKMTPVLL